VPIQDPVSVTLNQGEFILLHRARFAAARVTITANSNPEAGGVRFRTTRGLIGKTFESVGVEVSLRLIETIGGTTIEASTPEGVATLDVTYVVKTGRDA
jgi:hypothetical protein